LKLPFKSSFWISSFLFTFLQRFSLFGFSIASVIILTYTWSNLLIAIYALYQLIITTIELVKMGLLRNAMIKFLHDERYVSRHPQVQSASLMINFFFSLFVILLILTLSPWLAQLLKTTELIKLLHWSILLLIFQIPFNHCEIIQQSAMQYKTTFYAYFIRQGLLFCFIAWCVLFSPSFLTLEHLVVAQIVAASISAVFFVSASKTLLSWKIYFDKEVMTKLLHFGKYVFGTSLLSSIYKFADHFVTASAIGDPIAGKLYVSFYSVVARITGLLDFPFMAVADVLFPKNAQAMSTEGPAKVKYYFERMVGILTALIVPVSLFLFFVPELVLKVVTGPRYVNYIPAIPILQITMFFAFLRPFFSNFGFTMDSIGKPQLNFYFNLFIVLLSLGSTYLSIHLFGGKMGAVYATTFIAITSCTLIYVILKKHLNIQLSNIFRYMLATYIDLYSLIRNFSSRLKTV
jgi:O-antigen/teichoic acid export membrane protein